MAKNTNQPTEETVTVTAPEAEQEAVIETGEQPEGLDSIALLGKITVSSVVGKISRKMVAADTAEEIAVANAALLDNYAFMITGTVDSCKESKTVLPDETVSISTEFNGGFTVMREKDGTFATSSRLFLPKTGEMALRQAMELETEQYGKPKQGAIEFALRVFPRCNSKSVTGYEYVIQSLIKPRKDSTISRQASLLSNASKALKERQALLASPSSENAD